MGVNAAAAAHISASSDKFIGSGGTKTVSCSYTRKNKSQVLITFERGILNDSATSFSSYPWKNS
jgi:hypothetical protein